MNFDKYVFACHNVGKIVTVPKPLSESQAETLKAYRDRFNGVGRPLTAKQQRTYFSLEHKLNESNTFKLGEGGKSLCSELYFYAKHGRKKKVTSPQMEKGLGNEKEGRDNLSQVLGIPLTRDDEKKSNQWVRGYRDVKNDDVIIDIKSTWSFESFQKHLKSKPNELYLRQLDCYSELWGIEDSLLAHVLTNTPSHLLEAEIKKQNWTKDLIDGVGNIWKEKIPQVVNIVQDHIFTRKGLEEFCQQSAAVYIEWFEDFKEIELKDRIHLIPHKVTPTRLSQRNECITLAREYMNTLGAVNNI